MGHSPNSSNEGLLLLKVVIITYAIVNYDNRR